MNNSKDILLGMLLAVVAVSFLPYASFGPWAWPIIASGTGVLLCLWSALLAAGRLHLEVSPGYFRWHCVAIAVLLAWILVQSLLPVPASWEHPSWATARELISPSIVGTISAEPTRGLTRGVLLSTHVAMFWLTLQMTRRPDRARAALTALCCIGAGIGLVGLFAQLGGWTIFPWILEQKDQLRGTFLNRNHFATMTAMALVASTGLFLEIHAREKSRAIGGHARLKILTARTILNGGWLQLTLIVVLLTVLTLSGSRAGAAAALVGGMVLLGLYYLPIVRNWKRLWVPLSVFAAIVIMVLSVSGDFLLRRLETQSILDSERFLAYRDVIRGILDYPLTGVGYGTFAEAFQPYRGSDMTHLRLILENTYLEMMFELGVPAALLWFCVLAALVIRCVRGAIERRRDRVYPTVAVAAATAAGVHAIFDSSLQTPAVAWFLVVLLGVGVAQSWSTAHSNHLG